MSRRRGQQQQGFDTFIAQHAVDIGRGGKGIRTGRNAGSAPADRLQAQIDLGPTAQIDQAFRMWSDRHAEAEDGEAALHLAGRPAILMAVVTGLLCNIAARRWQRLSSLAWEDRSAENSVEQAAEPLLRLMQAEYWLSR